MNHRGAATVEASLVIPLFIFVMLAFVQMGFVMVVNKHVYTAFADAVEETAEGAYGWQICSLESRSAVVYANIYSKLKKELKSDTLVSKYVSGGVDGVLLKSAEMTEDGFVEADLRYYVQLSIPLLHSLKTGFYEKQKQKAYIGYQVTESAETYVYITDYQSVYHSSRGCTYLSLKIYEVSEKEAAQAGSKLKACGFCKKIGNRYYITEQGDCYHTTLACPGLSRTVYRVKKRSVERLAPCNRCN